QLLAGYGSAARRWLVATLQSFSFSFRRSYTFRSSTRACRRRCPAEFFPALGFARLPVLRSIWGNRGSRRFHGCQARTRLSLLTEFPLVFASLRKSRACARGC